VKRIASYSLFALIAFIGICGAYDRYYHFPKYAKLSGVGEVIAGIEPWNLPWRTATDPGVYAGYATAALHADDRLFCRALPSLRESSIVNVQRAILRELQARTDETVEHIESGSQPKRSLQSCST
jgi:hypothetical protein